MKNKARQMTGCSPFTLGTVQLGMAYGTGEDREKPSLEKAFGILDRAMELGIDHLDTANNYGDSETVIGQWLKGRCEQKKPLPCVITKIGPLKHGSVAKLREDVFRQIDGCCDKLGMDTLDCVMVHDFADYDQDRDALRDIFEELKNQKQICRSGISAYSSHDYGVIADSGFDVTQIPLNVFDWRQIENGGLQKLADSGMEIFVRSVFLQGLIFRSPGQLDGRMSFCFRHLEKYQKICQDFGLSAAVLALSFVLSVPGVTSAVLGCDNVKQLEENSSLFAHVRRLTTDQWEVLRRAFSGIDPRVTDPRCW